MMAIVGSLAATDPRMLVPIAAIEERLTNDRGLVHRYRADDGADGPPAKRAPSCSARSGSQKRWRSPIRLIEAEMFERAAGFANDLGLLVEEADPETGELLGSFPQAFSHIGFGNALGQSAKSSDELILDHVPSP